MPAEKTRGGFAGDPAEAFSPPAASGCCGGATATEAGSCCGGTATAQAGGCCGQEATVVDSSSSSCCG